MLDHYHDVVNIMVLLFMELFLSFGKAGKIFSHPTSPKTVSEILRDAIFLFVVISLSSNKANGSYGLSWPSRR